MVHTKDRRRVAEWGILDASKLNRLAGITQPTLVANGNNDIMIPTFNSYLLAGHLPLEARFMHLPSNPLRGAIVVDQREHVEALPAHHIPETLERPGT